jgi:hypothetical protein
MVTDERLIDIENDLRSAPEFFAKILKYTEENKELCEDLKAAPEFFEEMLQIVEELRSYRRAVLPTHFDGYKMKMIEAIPETGPHWGKRRRSSL